MLPHLLATHAVAPVNGAYVELAQGVAADMPVVGQKLEAGHGVHPVIAPVVAMNEPAGQGMMVVETGQ